MVFCCPGALLGLAIVSARLQCLEPCEGEGRKGGRESEREEGHYYSQWTDVYALQTRTSYYDGLAAPEPGIRSKYTNELFPNSLLDTS